MIIQLTKHVGAHGAMADALATKDIYFACRDNHEFMAAGSAFKTNEAKATASVATLTCHGCGKSWDIPFGSPCSSSVLRCPHCGANHGGGDASPKEPPAVAQPLVPQSGVGQEKAPQVGSAGLGDLFKLY